MKSGIKVSQKKIKQRLLDRSEEFKRRKQRLLYRSTMSEEVKIGIRKDKKRAENRRLVIARKTLHLENKLIPTGLEDTEGFHKHHVTRKYILSIPSFIHRTYGHSLLWKDGMLESNEIALTWLLGETQI